MELATIQAYFHSEKTLENELCGACNMMHRELLLLTVSTPKARNKGLVICEFCFTREVLRGNLTPDMAPKKVRKSEQKKVDQIVSNLFGGEEE
jgi:hypothetical protein